VDALNQLASFLLLREKLSNILSTVEISCHESACNSLIVELAFQISSEPQWKDERDAQPRLPERPWIESDGETPASSQELPQNAQLSEIFAFRSSAHCSAHHGHSDEEGGRQKAFCAAVLSAWSSQTAEGNRRSSGAEHRAAEWL
jgi:hypothetical protein